MDIQERLITNEAFWEFVEQHPDKEYEFINGVIVEMPSPTLLHGLIAAKILYFLMVYLAQNNIGVAVGDSNDFSLAPGIVFRPDAAFISREKLPEKLDVRCEFAPDLAVEVMSPSNLDILAKVDTYIRYGTRLVWVVYPESKTVFVYRPEPDGSLNLRKFTPDSVLDGGEVLPGFSVEVSRLFPEK